MLCLKIYLEELQLSRLEGQFQLHEAYLVYSIFCDVLELTWKRALEDCGHTEAQYYTLDLAFEGILDPKLFEEDSQPKSVADPNYCAAQLCTLQMAGVYQPNKQKRNKHLSSKEIYIGNINFLFNIIIILTLRENEDGFPLLFFAYDFEEASF